MKPGETDGSFYKKPVASSNKNVGGQGNGGELGGPSVEGVSNPRGIEPKKVGGGRMPLAQGPVEPKVGK